MQQQTAYLIVSWHYVVATLCLVLNRLYVRTLRREASWPAKWSDFLVVLAWFFNLFQSICDSVMYSKGAMVSLTTLDLDIPLNYERGTIFLKIYFVESFIYFISLYAIKGAILCFLLEVTPPSLRHIRRAIWAGMGICALFFTYTQLIYLVSCRPITFYWDLSAADDACPAVNYTIPVAVCMHMFTDAYIYTIPFVLISKLKVGRSQRISIGAMFGVGFLLVCFACAQALNVWVPSLADPVMWSFWCCIHEQSFAVTVACIPALRATVQSWTKSRRDRDESESSERRRSWRMLPLGKRMQRGELTTREVADKSSRSDKSDKTDVERSAMSSSGGGGIVASTVMTTVSASDVTND